MDVNYQPIENKPFYDTSLAKSYKPGENEYYANQAELFDDRDDGNVYESNRERKIKLSRKEKKRLSPEEKKALIKQSADSYKAKHRHKHNEPDEVMTYLDANGVERVKRTKSGKPRAVNPLKNKGRDGGR